MGSLPTRFIAWRSHDRPAIERRQLVWHSEVVLPVLCKYRESNELEKDLSTIPEAWVKLCHTEINLILGFFNALGDIVVKVAVDESLGFVVEGRFKEIPYDHHIYKRFKRTVSKKQINVILYNIARWKPCQGLKD